MNNDYKAVRELAPSITEEMVDRVEELVGTGRGAWDMVDPREIIAACWVVKGEIKDGE